MKAFDYAAPKTVKEAAGMLAGSWGETEVLAGGTDLVTSLKQGIVSPSRVISLKNVEGLRGISEASGALAIGAMTTLSELVANDAVKKHFPALVTAAKGVNGPQIMNLGTVGGDLVQRPRCWYYRMGFGLLGTENGQALIPNGDNRYHAIFGNSGPAYFVHPSSLAPALIALDATITAEGPSGSREIEAAEFFVTPKSDADRETVLKPNEIITSVSVPLSGKKNGVYEVRQRRGLDWPMVAAAVAYTDEGGTAKNVRVVLGHVAPTPWPSDTASKALEGQSVSESAAAKAGDAAAQGATPLSRNGYKVQQVKVAVKRAILAANA